jgi:ribosome assembly protein YihI (activator of Der GTPase)
MTEKLVIDVAAGTKTYVPLTPAEETDRVERQAEHAAVSAREVAHLRALAGVEPDAALLDRLRRGHAVSDADLEQLVRWLALRAIGAA